jgi:hypothetical protein
MQNSTKQMKFRLDISIHFPNSSSIVIVTGLYYLVSQSCTTYLLLRHKICIQNSTKQMKFRLVISIHFPDSSSIVITSIYCQYVPTSIFSAFLVICMSYTSLSASEDVVQIALVLSQKKTDLFIIEVFRRAETQRWNAVVSSDNLIFILIQVQYV